MKSDPFLPGCIRTSWEGEANFCGSQRWHLWRSLADFELSQRNHPGLDNVCPKCLELARAEETVRLLGLETTWWPIRLGP